MKSFSRNRSSSVLNNSTIIYLQIDYINPYSFAWFSGMYFDCRNLHMFDQLESHSCLSYMCGNKFRISPVIFAISIKNLTIITGGKSFTNPTLLFRVSCFITIFFNMALYTKGYTLFLINF